MNMHLTNYCHKAGMVLLVISFSIFHSCQTTGGPIEKAKGSSLEMLSWLPGIWRGKVDAGTTAEIWKKVDDSTFSGTGMVISGKDTTIVEMLQLEARNDSVYYIATVMGQQVVFKLTKMTTDQFVFENPAHDFPQVISYTRISKDSLVAEISGIVKGERRREVFKMAKW